MDTIQLKEIEHHYQLAMEKALELTKSEARKILKENKDLKEFIMAMGGAMFTDKKNEILNNDRERFSDFFNMLDDFDIEYNFKTTGTPVRFTTYGEEVTDW